MILFSGILFAGEMSVDYRYKPPRWRTPIGLPGDWQKSLVNQAGALTYDFGPGPYAHPGTVIKLGTAGETVRNVNQTIADARVPVIRTEKEYNAGRITEQTFTLVPGDWTGGEAVSEEYRVRRHNGTVGTIAWADPVIPADSAFRNVAYGTNRPIRYTVEVSPGSRHLVVLGFCDSYRRKGKTSRLMELRTEGAQHRVVNVVEDGGQNIPQVYYLQAEDGDRDGLLDIQVHADFATDDPNIFLNALWLFPHDTKPDREALIRGDLSGEAEVYVDCGLEPQILDRAARRDLLHAEIQGELSPVLSIETGREMTYDAGLGVFKTSGKPYLTTTPQPDTVLQVDRGWKLLYPQGIRTLDLMVIHGHSLSSDVTQMPDFSGAKARAREFWIGKSDIPWERIEVPDQGIQQFFLGCIRTIYQVAEYQDGQLQFQPGPTVYRGMWASSHPRHGRAITYLGDVGTARSSMDRLISHQQDNGQVVILTPATLLKETGITMRTLVYHARLTGDRDWLQQYWPQLKEAAQWINAARKQTLDNPGDLNYGLMPAGFSDGGVGGVVPEYNSVYWSLLGLQSMADAAVWLGEIPQSYEYHRDLSDLMTAFRKAASRDLRQDDHGNWYLPIRMDFDPEEHIPQRAMTQLSFMTYPARLFPPDDPLIQGNMAMLRDAPRAGGLILSTGWLDGGVQPFIENTRASARLWLGEIDRAQEIMYAAVNHAAPTHVWVEEQKPGTGPRKTTGDVPHSSASAEFINLIRYTLAMEGDRGIALLKGVPEQWYHPGATIRMDSVLTEFGPLSLTVEIADDGQSGRIELQPLARGEKHGKPLVYLKPLINLGYLQRNGVELPVWYGGEWNEKTEIQFVKRKSVDR